MKLFKDSENRTASPDRRAQQITRFMLIVLLLVVLVALVRWGLSRSAAQSEAHNVYFVGKTQDMSIEFWRTLDEGLNDAAKEFNVNVTFLKATDESHIDENRIFFEEAVAAKPELIILSASDAVALADSVATAVKNGQKVIMLDSDVERTEGAEPLSLIATNNRVAGQNIAAFLVEDLQPDAHIVIIVQQVGMATADQRRQGALDVLEEKGFSHITTIDAHSSKETAKTALLDLLAETKVDAVIAVNEYTTEAAAFALKEASMDGKIPLVGIDSSRALVPFIEDGTIKASVVQQPYNIGYLSLKAAVEVLDGKQISSQIDVDSKLITKDVLYLPENQKLLFPFQITD